MAFASHTVEDTLTTAQHALAVHYGNSYPCSNRVQESLRELLNQKFDGSPKSFVEKFLRPTTLLLEQLKAEGFPVVKDGRVILHLSAPLNHLEVGEMFFQVGHTTPGTLTLKFAKLRSNTVFLQPAIIGEIEYHLAFTQRYLQQLRKEAGTSGGNLLQLLVVSTINGQDCATEKIGVNRIMPFSFGHSINGTPSSAIDHPVNNGNLSCRQPEENSSFQPVRHSLDDRTGFQARPLANSSTSLMNTDRKHKEQQSDPSTRNNIVYPALPQAAYNLPPPNSNEQFQHECSSVAVFDYNPAYSPLSQAERDQTTQERTDQQLQTENFPGTSNPPYPPVHEAVNDQPIPDETVTGQPEHSSSAGGNNPQYPPIHRAVRDQPTPEAKSERPFKEELSRDGGEKSQSYPSIYQAVIHQSTSDSSAKEPSSCLSGSNPPYPPIHQAVGDHTKPEDTGQLLFQEEPPSAGEERNPSYPSIHQAVSNQGTPDTGQHEHSSGASRNNPPYPPIHRAVRDQTTPEDTGPPLFKEEPPSSGEERNPSYPSIHQKVDVQGTIDNGQHEHLSGAGANNPQYPSIHRAVRDELTPEDMGQQNFKEKPASVGRENNPSYPSIHQAISDQCTTHSGGQGHSSGAVGDNPQYPPIQKAVRDQPTSEDVDQQPSRAEQSPDGGEENPLYPSIHQAITDQRITSTARQEHSSGAGTNNAQYPPIYRAVRDQPTSEDTDKRPSREEHSSNLREKNPSYPPIHQAVDDQCKPHAGHLRNSPGVGVNNPPYPPIHQAVDDQCKPHAGHLRNPPGAGVNNPPYPPIHQAVSDQPTPDTSDHEHSSDASGPDPSQWAPSDQNTTENTGHQNARAQVTGAVGNNPTYLPPQAVGSVSACSAQTGGNNPTYLPPQAIRSVSVNSAQSDGKNPTYLPPQALRSTSTGCTHTKSDQASSDACRSDSSHSNSRNSTTAIPITDPYRFLEDDECQF